MLAEALSKHIRLPESSQADINGWPGSLIFEDSEAFQKAEGLSVFAILTDQSHDTMASCVCKVTEKPK